MQARMKTTLAIATAIAALGGAVFVSANSAKPRTEVPVSDLAGLDPAAELRAISVPTSVDDASALGCTGGWAGFTNPVAGYSICYPSGWGFTTLESAKPLLTLNGAMLGSVRLLSGDAFPWPVGSTPLALVGSRDIIDLEVASVPTDRPHAVDTGDCTPIEPTGLALACEQGIEPTTGAVSVNGSVTELYAVLAGSAPGESQLIVRARYRSALKRDTIVRVVASMRRSKREGV